MSLSPLAQRIYRTLVRRVRSPNPLVSCGDLVRGLGPLPPPDTDLKPNDQRLFDALGEIFRACRGHEPPLRALTLIVVRRAEDGSLGTPGPGYFALVFPHVREETARLQMWRAEVSRVVATPYPEELLLPDTFTPPVVPRILPGWLHEPAVIAAVIGLVGTVLTVAASVWMASRRDEPQPQRQSGLPVATVIAKGDERSRPRPPETPVVRAELRKLTLEEILDVLERHHQRATFGTVGGILERDPESLFKGYARTPRTAWVVNKATELPTGTKAGDYPPGLLKKERIIDTPEELRLWLGRHR